MPRTTAAARQNTTSFSPFNREGVDNLTIIFPSADKRSAFESCLLDAKNRLTQSLDRKVPPPEFLFPLPIRKTRAGLQFTCASATAPPAVPSAAGSAPPGAATAATTTAATSSGPRDVWICNSDGYVGQVCVLSLEPPDGDPPTVTSCNGVCNARILCLAAVPAFA